MDVGGIRREYRDLPLHREQLREHPMDQLAEWLAEAAEAGIIEPNAMALATASLEGRPSVRMVLAKAIDPLGITFYTNYQSRKAQEIAVNPFASVNFFWREFERQVIVEGNIEQVPRTMSERYWRDRPRGSQLGAWASQQGQVIAARSVLERQLAEVTQRFEGREVPIPEAWGGFHLIATRLEVWQGRRDRLHDRFQYRRDGESWVIERVSP